MNAPTRTIDAHPPRRTADADRRRRRLSNRFRHAQRQHAAVVARLRELAAEAAALEAVAR